MSSNIFCPFVNGDCKSNCVFNDTNLTLPNACSIFSFLQAIKENTGTDQTYSPYIDTKLGDISTLLERKL